MFLLCLRCFFCNPQIQSKCDEIHSLEVKITENNENDENNKNTMETLNDEISKLEQQCQDHSSKMESIQKGYDNAQNQV